MTRHLSDQIIHGVTRDSLLKLACEAQMRIEERSFTLEEAYRADEAFITSASKFVCPVVEINGNPVADGTPGPVARRLREIYIQHARETAI